MEISLDVVWRALKKSYILLLCVVVVCASGAYFFTEFMISPTYVSTAKINIIGDINADTVVEMNNQFVFANKMVKTCISLLETKNFSETVEKDSKAGKTPNLKFSFDEDTTIITIKSYGSTPDIAYENAYAASQSANAFIMEKSGTNLTVTIVDDPSRPQDPTEPNPVKNSLIAGIVSFAVVLIIQIVRELLGTRVKSEDELSKRYSTPVIAVVPDFNENIKHKKYGRYYSYGYGYAKRSEENNEKK